MSRLSFAFLVALVIVTAIWTYQITYRTTDALDRVADLRARIAAEREAVQVLTVEWAWLNRPERLNRLVAAHQDKLGLVPMQPETFGVVASLPFREEPTPPRPFAADTALVAGAGPQGLPASAPGEGVAVAGSGSATAGRLSVVARARTVSAGQ